MTARRSLNLKLALSILLAFAVSLAVTWGVHGYLAAREADKLIDRAFADVQAEIVSRVNARLVRQAMAVRERLESSGRRPSRTTSASTSRRRRARPPR